MFLPCNFELEIDGINCSKVSRIEALTVRQTAISDDAGDARDYQKEPGKLEFPNLKITMPEAAAQPFSDWLEDFVIKGNNSEAQEKGGVLTLLASNRSDALARITFHNLGIFKVQPVKRASNAGAIPHIEVEMYMERMEFAYVAMDAGKISTTAPAPAPAPAPLRPTLRRTE